MHNFMLIPKKKTSPAHTGRRKNSTGGNSMGSLMSVRNDDLVKEVQVGIKKQEVRTGEEEDEKRDKKREA